MQNLAQKFTFVNSAQTLLCLGSQRHFVFLVEKPENPRFVWCGLRLTRFRSGNIRWTKAQGLGRGETGITHKTFCEIKHAKTSCSLAQYRYTYEASGAKRSTAMTHWNRLRFFLSSFPLFLKFQLRILEIRGFYVLLAKKLCFKYGTWRIPLYTLGKRSDLQRSRT